MTKIRTVVEQEALNIRLIPTEEGEKMIYNRSEKRLCASPDEAGDDEMFQRIYQRLLTDYPDSVNYIEGRLNKKLVKLGRMVDEPISNDDGLISLDLDMKTLKKLKIERLQLVVNGTIYDYHKDWFYHQEPTS